MSAKHTPGPLLEALIRISEWEYRSDRRGRGMVDVSEIESLKRIARAALAKISDFGTIIAFDVLEHNAHLIAAAPEGLALAEHIAAMATDPYLCDHPEWEHIVAEAQALITKATP